MSEKKLLIQIFIACLLVIVLCLVAVSVVPTQAAEQPQDCFKYEEIIKDFPSNGYHQVLTIKLDAIYTPGGNPPMDLRGTGTSVILFYNANAGIYFAVIKSPSCASPLWIGTAPAPLKDKEESL